MRWLKKMVHPPTEPWQHYFEFKMEKSAIELALQRNTPRRLARVSPFFAEIFRYWTELHGEPPSSEMAIRNEFLWGNKFLKGKVKKKMETFCRNHNILKVNDLLHYGRFLSATQFIEIHGCTPLPGLLLALARLLPEE